MSTPERAKVYTLAGLIGELADEHAIAEKAIAEGRNLGPLVQYERLSDELGGTWPIGMIGLHATPGAGKSAYAIDAAINTHCPTIYLTCEMSAKTILRRIIANKSGTYMGKLQRGKMSASDIRTLAETIIANLPHFGIIDATTAPCSADLLRECVEKMRVHDEHVFLVIDSLHAWASSLHPQLEEYQAISTGVETLRAISAEYNVATLAILERNRVSMQSGGINAGAASRKIEYSSEIILQLDAVGTCAVAGMHDAAAVNLKFVKNRNGRAGVSIGYAFQGASQRFAEIGMPWTNHESEKEKHHAHASERLNEEPEENAA